MTKELELIAASLALHLTKIDGDLFPVAGLGYDTQSAVDVDRRVEGATVHVAIEYPSGRDSEGLYTFSTARATITVDVRPR